MYETFKFALGKKYLASYREILRRHLFLAVTIQRHLSPGPPPPDICGRYSEYPSPKSDSPFLRVPNRPNEEFHRAFLNHYGMHALNRSGNPWLAFPKSIPLPAASLFQ